MRSALFSTQDLLSGSPPDARSPQAGRSAASAHPVFPPRRPLLGPCATSVLGVGPETRSLPAAGSSEPHFLQAGRGEAESISCCALTAAETSSQSAPSGGRPGAKVQLGAGPHAGGVTLRLPSQPGLPPQPRARPPDHLPPQRLPPTGLTYPEQAEANLQRPKNHLPSSV